MAEKKQKEQKHVHGPECGHENQQADVQAYLEFQMLSQQLKELQQKLAAVGQQMNDILAIKEALSDLNKAQVGSDMLAPMASGIFVKSKLADNKELLVNVGNNVVVAKTTDEAKGLLDAQFSELRNLEQNLAVQWQQIVARMQEIEGLLK
jgi:prefoldin alpha subunit